MTIDEATTCALEELGRAQEKFPPMHSDHEAYAILIEEVEEMWQEIKHGTKERSKDEAIQVAAMALRMLVDRY